VNCAKLRSDLSVGKPKCQPTCEFTAVDTRWCT